MAKFGITARKEGLSFTYKGKDYALLCDERITTDDPDLARCAGERSKYVEISGKLPELMSKTEALTKKELMSKAKGLGIQVTTKMTKAELVDAIESYKK